MRYWIGFVCAVALAALPAGVSAQSNAQDETVQPESTSRDTGKPVSPGVRERTRRQWDPAVVYKVPTTPNHHHRNIPGLVSRKAEPSTTVDESV